MNDIHDRMDSLVNLQDYADFMNAAKKIMKDLEEEGFEKKDIFYYLYSELMKNL